MTEEEGVTDSEDVVTGGRNLLSVPAPGGDGEEGAAFRVGDFGGTMADSFEIGGVGQGGTGIEQEGCASLHLQRCSCWTEGLSTGLSGVPTNGMSGQSLELDASHMQNEACMLIMLTSLAVEWASLLVKPRLSKSCKTFGAQ